MSVQGFIRKLFLLSLALAWSAASADAYPSKPVRLIAAYPPGGSVDMVARRVADKLTQAFGQPFIVENRAGASGNIGTDYVAKATPDGYTLLVGSSAALSSAVHVFAKLPFDPIRDFAPIVLVANQPNVLVVHPSMPVKTVEELIAMAKERPRGFTYASSGNGTSNHMAAEMFMMKTGVELVQVPYKGGAPAVSDLVGGHVNMMFETVPTLGGFIKDGKLRPLAVTSAKRLTSLPDVRTMQEAGLEDFDFRGWIGLLAPAGTPPEIIAKLNQEVQEALKGDLKESLASLGLDVAGGSADEFSKFLRSDLDKYGVLVKRSGIPKQ